MRLAVVGLGLIGGSIGLAARSRAGATVTGYDPDGRALRAALELGAIDHAAETLAGAAGDAEAVFVAAPVGTLAPTVAEVLAAAGQDCLVSDVGSVKRPLVEAVADERVVGGHPLAGAETAGVEHARADLFEGASWYLTPGPGASPALSRRLREIVTALGAQPCTIDPAAHDRLMASFSHLPHVLANVLVAGAGAALLQERGRGTLAAEDDGVFVGPSFRDATRVAGANTAIWRDIYLANRQALVVAIDDALGRLRDVRHALLGEDAEALAAWNERAGAERERLAGQPGVASRPGQGSAS